MGISEARDSLSIIKRQQRCNTLAVKDGEESIVEHMVGEGGRGEADNLVQSEQADVPMRGLTALADRGRLLLRPQSPKQEVVSVNQQQRLRTGGQLLPQDINLQEPSRSLVLPAWFHFTEFVYFLMLACKNEALKMVSHLRKKNNIVYKTAQPLENPL